MDIFWINKLMHTAMSYKSILVLNTKYEEWLHLQTILSNDASPLQSVWGVIYYNFHYVSYSKAFTMMIETDYFSIFNSLHLKLYVHQLPLIMQSTYNQGL